MPRLQEIHANLADRLQEAKDQGWLGEVAAIETTLAAAAQKLAAMHQMAAGHITTYLGMPDYRPAVGRSSPQPPTTNPEPASLCSALPPREGRQGDQRGDMVTETDAAPGTRGFAMTVLIGLRRDDQRPFIGATVQPRHLTHTTTGPPAPGDERVLP